MAQDCRASSNSADPIVIGAAPPRRMSSLAGLIGGTITPSLASFHARSAMAAASWGSFAKVGGAARWLPLTEPSPSSLSISTNSFTLPLATPAMVVVASSDDIKFIT